MRIADGVTSIGYRAFEGCVNLVSIVIPLSVQIIGNDVFKDCANLATIAIPDSVTDLGGDAFAGCTALTVIDVFDGEKQPVSFRTELENGKQCNLNAWLGANNGKSNMSMARNFVSPIVATFLKFEPPLTGRPLQLVTRDQVGASKAARLALVEPVRHDGFSLSSTSPRDAFRERFPSSLETMLDKLRRRMFCHFVSEVTGKEVRRWRRLLEGGGGGPVVALFDRWRVELEGAEINPPKTRAGGAIFPCRFRGRWRGRGASPRGRG